MLTVATKDIKGLYIAYQDALNLMAPINEKARNDLLLKIVPEYATTNNGIDRLFTLNSVLGKDVVLTRFRMKALGCLGRIIVPAMYFYDVADFFKKN